jgi:hypothetical protein
MLCAADVHVHGEDHPTWQQLVGEPGSRIRDDYRKAAAWLLPRLTVPAGVAPATDGAAPELTEQEARDLVDELGLQLYRAEDALAFVEECCVIADREGRQPTTADVREWLKGARCGRQLASDATDRATRATDPPVKQRADLTETEWAEQERARFERLYTRETVRADLAEQRADTAARDADIYQKRLERLSEGYTEQRKRAEAMEHAMESTAADALKHRGCHRDLMAQCLRAERAEAEAEQLRTDWAAACICGHTEAQHFEDACLVCDCGDYLVPEAAREVIARWRTAALQARADRAAEWRAAAADLLAAFPDPTVQHIGVIAASHLRLRAREIDAGRPVLDRAAESAPADTGPAGDETGEARPRETVEYFLQAQQDDGTWESASSFMDALDWATERLAAKRARYPEFVFRLAQRTTKVAVTPLPDCVACRHWSCNGTGTCGALLDAWQKCPCTGASATSGVPAGGAQQPKETRP